jgi:hypothetical protein
MKPVYLGGVRGYQSAVYKPGMGWSGTESHRYIRPRQAAVRTASLAYPMTVARQRRPGPRTKIAILAIMATVAGVLSLIFSGAAQL